MFQGRMRPVYARSAAERSSRGYPYRCYEAVAVQPAAVHHESLREGANRLLKRATQQSRMVELHAQRLVLHERTGARILRLVQRLLGREDRERAPAPP